MAGASLLRAAFLDGQAGAAIGLKARATCIGLPAMEHMRWAEDAGTPAPHLRTEPRRPSPDQRID
jgi:hypothetical protein